MSTPQPVDLNKLKNILGASKAIMNKVETGNFETGNIDPRALTEDGVAKLQSEGIKRPSSNPIGYTEDMVKNSNLPPVIKKAMIENPIPQLTNPAYTFSLDDVSDLSEEKKMGLPKVPKTKTITESYNKSGINVTREDLRDMVNDLVNEKLLEFFMKTHNKTLTEETVRKTINTLIKEGKLTQKKRTV
jgi:hypothetical protein